MGNTKAHWRPQWNTHGAYQYKKKIYNLKGRNNTRAVKSATVVIFEDPKRRVVSLLNEAHDDHTDEIHSVSWVCGYVLPSENSGF